MNRSAPKELNYADQVPLAIPSSSNRREFTPNNGQTFAPTNANVIRIEVNSDNYLDTAHSYLQATLKNTTTNDASGDYPANTNYLATDIGPSWIHSLRIESGGVTLEHITSYNKLYAFLQLAQSSVVKNNTENAVFTNDNGMIKSQSNSTSFVQSVVVAPFYNEYTFGSRDVNYKTPSNHLLRGESYTYSIPLMSALFNASKYLPLILVNAGLVIEITLASGHEVGIAQALTATGTIPSEEFLTPDYTITDVKYVAHLIDLDRSFNQVLRDNMASAGAITLHGTMWRHFQSSFSGTTHEPVINIPARMKSIKSIFSMFRDQSNTNGRFHTGVSTQSKINQWQYKIGSVSYPQAPVKIGSQGVIGFPPVIPVNGTGISPTYCELLKAFGRLGTTDTHTCLGPQTYGMTGEQNPRGGACVKMFVIGYDVESFSKSVIESGIDTASRALPISLELSRTGDSATGIENIINDNYVCGDGFFYFNPDGTITPSV